VQGVGFRQALAARARSLGVAGRVLNRADGAVEAVFEGEPDAVARLLAFVEEGPRGARVDRVEVRDEDPEGLAGFAIWG
jgi:acylphosphatase